MKINDRKRNKWDKQSTVVVYLGESSNRGGHKVYCLFNKRITDHNYEDTTSNEIVNENHIEGNCETNNENEQIEEEYEEEMEEEYEEECEEVIENTQRYDNFITYINQSKEVKDIKIPRNYNEAMKSEEREYWKKAIEVELQALKNHEVWFETKREKNIKEIKTRWIFSIKEEGGRVEKFKARFVAKGFSQIEGKDYFEDNVYSH